VGEFLQRLAGAGVIRLEERRVLGVFRTRRWVVVDETRRPAARRRLDAIVRSTGPVAAKQAAFAGLVHAVGLGPILYPTRENQAARDRLEAIGLLDENVVLVGTGRPTRSDDSADDGDTSIYVASNASIQSATMSAVHSSVSATHHAVVEHHQLAHDGGSGHDGGSHHGGGGMGGGGHHG
jgi:Golgi phosphoprotein 3 (GPP34)